MGLNRWTQKWQESKSKREGPGRRKYKEGEVKQTKTEIEAWLVSFHCNQIAIMVGNHK